MGNIIINIFLGDRASSKDIISDNDVFPKDTEASEEKESTEDKENTKSRKRTRKMECPLCHDTVYVKWNPDDKYYPLLTKFCPSCRNYFEISQPGHDIRPENADMFAWQRKNGEEEEEEEETEYDEE